MSSTRRVGLGQRAVDATTIDSEQFGCFRHVAFRAAERALDERQFRLLKVEGQFLPRRFR